MKIRIIKKKGVRYHVQYRTFFCWKTIDWFLSLENASDLYDKVKKGEIKPNGVIKEDYVFYDLISKRRMRNHLPPRG